MFPHIVSCLISLDMSRLTTVIFGNMPLFLGIENEPFTTFFTKILFDFTVLNDGIQSFSCLLFCSSGSLCT